MTGMIRSPINFNRVIRACIQTGAFRLSVFDENEKKKKKIGKIKRGINVV